MSPERPRYRADRPMPKVALGHILAVEPIDLRPYRLTELDAQLRAYSGLPAIQEDIIATFERGDAYVEES